MTALTFVLSDLATGRVLGHALLCAEARYASVAWLGAGRLDRRFVERGDWRPIEQAIRDGIPNTPLESTHVLARLLLPDDRRTSVMVQRVAELPVDVAPARVAWTLDGWLRDLAQTAKS